MQSKFCFSLLAGAVLLGAPPIAAAESPLPDPIAPAVIGRPLDQIRPGRPVGPKPLAVKPAAPKQAAAQSARSTSKNTSKAARPPAPATQAARASQGAQPQPATQALGAGPAQAAAAVSRPAKEAVDDRPDPHVQLAEVGKGSHMGRKPLEPGVYFGDKHRNAVRKYYQQHPVSGTGVKWQIGEPVPRGTRISDVPRGLLASLPDLPPGHRYIDLGGEVVLIAAGSRMVVDGISRSAR